MSTREERDLLRIIIHGTSAFELLRSGVEFGLFEKLEKANGMDLDAVASALGVEKQPARILLLGLASLGLLKKKGTKYVNSEVASEKLVPGKQQYIVPLIQMQAKVINPALVDLAESIRKYTNVGLRRLEGPGDTLYKRLTATPDLQKVFYDNMGDASARAFSSVHDVYDFKDLKHVVDVGGGDGTNAIELTKRYPHMHATVFDQESVCKIALENAKRAGVGDRVHAHVGDFFKDPLPKGVDGVMSFHIFGMWSLKRNTDLLRRAYEALNPNGVVFVTEFVCNDEDTGPLTPAFMSAYFLALATGEGMCYSLKDMEESVREAGFTKTQRFDLPFFHGLVTGVKA